MDKVKLFLERGYFPVQLPPAFATVQFARKYKQILLGWGSNPSAPRNKPERFSVARSSYNRRLTSILNPVSYLLLCRSVASYWSRIQNHYSRSKFSFSRPKLERGLRAIKINRFSDVHDHKILTAAGYRYALITDVSQFFPTIYTHSIPWALHTQAVAKVQRAKTAQYFGNILDRDSMAVQDFQTMGLPIGPDTSHVIAEIVGVAIDRELRAALGRWPSGFRYVDDFYLFFNDRTEAERALSVVRRIVGSYELQINAQKTRIVETRELIEESWKYKLKNLAIAAPRHEQRNDIHKFFETLLTLEKQYRDESVVKYGLKIASSSIIKKSNWRVFESYLLHCAFAFPNTLQVVASLLATYAAYGYGIDKRAVARFCNAIISGHAGSDGHSEIVWALWIMFELDLKLQPESVRAIEDVSSSACLLLATALLRRQGSALRLSASKLAMHSNADALYGEGWLFAYEGGRRLWLDKPTASHIAGEKYFGPIHAAGVSFFDDSARLPPIFSLRGGGAFTADLFDSDADLEEFFEFDESDEEYFDGDGGDDEDDENDDDEDEDEDEDEWDKLL
jgi:hypothetical protein